MTEPVLGPPIPRSNNWKLIDLTDKYVLPFRLKCEVDGKIPEVEWSKHPEWKTIRDLEANIRTCTLYPVPAGLEILKRFKAKRWLDPTAGWGDRLRCAMLYKPLKLYVATDTNLSLHPAYQKMIKDLSPKSTHHKYQVFPKRFQDVDLSKYPLFDLVFTSPPFYTKEIYEHMVHWKSITHFLREFLYPLFRKSIKHLQIGGHLILYIEDTKSDPFIPLMINYTKKQLKRELQYLGVIYYEGATPRPYYVWKRV